MTFSETSESERERERSEIKRGKKRKNEREIEKERKKEREKERKKERKRERKKALPPIPSVLYSSSAFYKPNTSKHEGIASAEIRPCIYIYIYLFNNCEFQFRLALG